MVAQTQSETHHPISHKYIALRTSSGGSGAAASRAQSDLDSEDDSSNHRMEDDNDDAVDDTKGAYDDLQRSDNIFDKDYIPHKFNRDYNYLDPNFLPQ